MNLRFWQSNQAPALETKDEEISLDELAARFASLSKAYSGESVRPDNAMRCVTIQAIVRAFTNAIGMFPPYVGQTQQSPHGTYVQRDPNHGLNRLFRRPNACHTSTEYFRTVMQQILLYGNHYSIKGQGQTGPIAYLRPVEDPDAVTLDDINQRANKWGMGPVWRVMLDGGTDFIPDRRMFRVTSGIMSPDGVTGISPVEQAKEAIGLCIAAERFVAELYGNNAMPTIILTGGKFKNAEQYDTWSSRWKLLFGRGRSDRMGTGMLPEGMDAKELSFKPIDAQVLEMRKFQRIEIASAYNIPPHKLADLERATFSNIEEQSLEFARDATKPWFKLIAESMMRDLMTASDVQQGYVVGFDTESATEGKLVDRMTAYDKAYRMGAMNPNEVRQRLGMDPREDEGGEAYATAMNMRTTDDDDVSDEVEDEEAGSDDAGGQPKSSSIRAVR